MPASRLLTTITLLAAMAGTAPRQTAPPVVPLFDGKTLSGWIVENTDRGNFTVRDGVLRVEGPQGWLRSAREYGNFTLTVECRFVTDDADSGVFLRAPGPASNIFMRGWPANAYQVQVRDMSKNRTTNPIWIGNLYRHRVAPGETSFDADAALGAVKPTGEWQTIPDRRRGRSPHRAPQWDAGDARRGHRQSSRLHRHSRRDRRGRVPARSV